MEALSLQINTYTYKYTFNIRLIKHSGSHVKYSDQFGVRTLRASSMQYDQSHWTRTKGRRRERKDRGRKEGKKKTCVKTAQLIKTFSLASLRLYILFLV